MKIAVLNMLQSWLWGLNSFLREGPANWPSHQSTNGSSVFYQVLPQLWPPWMFCTSKPCESYNGELLWVSLQGTKNKQFHLPFFRLHQSFWNFSTALSSSALLAWRLELVKIHMSQDTVHHFQYSGNHMVEVINKWTLKLLYESFTSFSW